MLIKHAKADLGCAPELTDITQAQLETYQALVLEGGKDPKSAAGLNSLLIRSAVSAGFLNGVVPEQIGNMKPWQVAYITEQILKFVTEQTSIPPQ